MVNRFLLASTIALLITTQLSGICTPGNVRRKIDQSAQQSIQKLRVNSGKEMWRLEAPQVAAREAAALDPGFKGAPDKAPVRFLKGDDRTQLFQYTATDGRILELTLNKPEWLLPWAGLYKLEMWVVLSVKTTCGKQGNQR